MLGNKVNDDVYSAAKLTAPALADLDLHLVHLFTVNPAGLQQLPEHLQGLLVLPHALGEAQQADREKSLSG